jgi:hypothetical protein
MSINSEIRTALVRLVKVADGYAHGRNWSRGALLDAIAAARATLAQPPAAQPAPVAAPEPGEVAELVAWLRNRDRWTQLTDAQVDRAATLLQQLSAPAPAVVPPPCKPQFPPPQKIREDFL